MMRPMLRRPEHAVWVGWGSAWIMCGRSSLFTNVTVLPEKMWRICGAAPTPLILTTGSTEGVGSGVATATGVEIDALPQLSSIPTAKSPTTATATRPATFRITPTPTVYPSAIGSVSHDPRPTVPRFLRVVDCRSLARRSPMRLLPALLVSTLAVGLASPVPAEDAATPDPAQRLQGFDAYMEKVVKDWNVPGIGVAVVVKDKVVFAKGYGYRDYGKKLPFTARTVVPIASNTKLFTATGVGLLVEDGKLEWDKPIRQFVPGARFYNDELNATVTIRDMLAHRTGITRHDSIWYKSDFTRKELFERLKYLEPAQPIRQTFLYNNMMYTGAGYVIELLSGRKWEDFTRERLLV